MIIPLAQFFDRWFKTPIIEAACNLASRKDNELLEAPDGGGDESGGLQL